MSIHLIWSVFFLICHMVLLLTYLLAAAVVLTLGIGLLFFFWEWWKWNLHIASREIPVRIKVFIKNRRTYQKAGFIILLVIAYNLCLYMGERHKWMGKDNANLTAKEYWVAGQVVYTTRILYAKNKHIDAYFIRPFNWLQNWIYKKGIQYLPEDDGETGVWTNMWFIYPYSWNFSKTRGTHYAFRPDQGMMDLVDRCWFSMDRQASFSFADRQMEEECYFREFPGQVFYYLSKQGWLTGRLYGSHPLFLQNPRLMARMYSLNLWLQALKEEWRSSPQTLDYLKAHPKIEAMLQISLQMNAGELMLSSVYSREFKCNSRQVKDYVRFRNEFVGDAHGPLQRMTDKNQAGVLYDVAVDTIDSKGCAYILGRFCKISVAGGEEMYGLQEGKMPWKQKREIQVVQGIFKPELEILEEIYDGK